MMMRGAALMLLICASDATVCEGERCAAKHDTSNLMQKYQSVDDDEDGWSFQNAFVKGLMDKLAPDSVTEKVDQIIEDNSISLDSAQDRLYGLAHKFGSRLNKTIGAAQDRISSMQEYVNEKGHMIKDKSLLQAVSTITSLGDAAVDVAEKVTDEVEQGQLKVRQLLALVQSERVESRRQELRRSMQAATTTLNGLLHALQDAIGKSNEEDTDIEIPANVPDVTEAAIEKAKLILTRTDAVLERSKTYIEFVQTRVVEVREEATQLAEQAGNQTDAAFDASNKLADDLIAKLGEIDGMLGGNVTFADARKVLQMKKKSAASAAGVGLAALCLAGAMSTI